MTAIFLENWDFTRKETTDITLLKPKSYPSDGIVVPYSDSPFTKNFLSKNLYLQMLSLAKKEIYITTP